MEVCQPKKMLYFHLSLFSVSTLPYNVQLVNIYLSTATFDEIEKDVKVTTEELMEGSALAWLNENEDQR